MSCNRLSTSFLTTVLSGAPLHCLPLHGGDFKKKSPSCGETLANVVTPSREFIGRIIFISMLNSEKNEILYIRIDKNNHNAQELRENKQHKSK